MNKFETVEYHLPGLETKMPFTVIGHLAQCLDNFFAKLGTFHDGLNLNKDMEEADGGINNLS